MLGVYTIVKPAAERRLGRRPRRWAWAPASLALLGAVHRARGDARATR